MTAMNRRDEAKRMLEKCVIEMMKTYVVETEVHSANLDRVIEYAHAESVSWANMAALLQVAKSLPAYTLLYLTACLPASLPCVLVCLEDCFYIRTSV